MTEKKLSRRFEASVLAAWDRWDLDGHDWTFYDAELAVSIGNLPAGYTARSVVFDLERSIIEVYGVNDLITDCKFKIVIDEPTKESK